MQCNNSCGEMGEVAHQAHHDDDASTTEWASREAAGSGDDEEESTQNDENAAALSRKRPPSKRYCEDNDAPTAHQRPRTEAPSDDDDDDDLVESAASKVQDAVTGIINLSTATTHSPNNLSYPPPAVTQATAATSTTIAAAPTIMGAAAMRNNNAMAQFHNFPPPAATATTTAAAPNIMGTAAMQNNNAMAQFHNSVVHLSITKTKPSFTEPWRKFPPISLVGTGVAIPWNDVEQATDNCVENEAGGATRAADGTLNNNTKSTSNESHSEKNNRNNSATRILTNAHAVQYATSIRARTQQSPISVGCTVEWISLAMDLALLKVADTTNNGWNAIIPPPISANLPNLGEELTCIRFPTMAISDMSASSASSIQHLLTHGRYSDFFHLGSRHHVEWNMHRGVVAGFYADEDEHHVLRLKMKGGFGENNNSAASNDGGGIVVGGDGRIVGMIASSSQAASAGFSSVIPGGVINRFLNLCHGASSQPYATTASAQAFLTTDAEGSAASRDTGDETSLSDRGSRTPQPIGKSYYNGIKCLSNIPTLGITGFQTLENKALRRTLGLEESDGTIYGDSSGAGIRILGINHTVHPTIDNEYQSQSCKEDKKCHTSMLRTDDVLLAVNDEPIRLDGTVRLAPGRENERVDFRWLISQRPVGAAVKLDVMRHKKRMQLYAALSAPRHLVPKCDEPGEDVPSYVICGGCVFVPLTQAWLSEMVEKQQTLAGSRHCANSLSSELQGFTRYLQEQRKGDQQIIILSHVLPDDVNVGYHAMCNMVLTSVNGQRPINNLQHLMDLLVKRENGQSLEFRCSYVHLDRAKVVICMDAKEIMDSETRIMSNYFIDAWCSNALSPALKREAEGKAHRHGVTCGLKTMRAFRNAVRETTLVVRRGQPTTDDNSAVAATRRIMDWSETHKMQSAPLFAGKYTEEGGWTQVKTKHLSQLCACGKSTRFYCICSVGVMRCKDCFMTHCRDHTHNHECSETCTPNCEGGAEVLAEGVELVTTKKRKRNNPTQAIQSRCVVCKAKTCYCCSACGFEKEVALCHVSTGRNCLPIHTSEHHNAKSG